MFLGIVAGLACALFQSVSYVCSAGFMLRYKSSLRLVIFSQLVMGAFCLPFAPFLFPPQLLECLPEFILWVIAWIGCFTVGQIGFFTTLRSIEASRMSSLLGLKMLVLAMICVLFAGTPLSGLQWFAVLLSTVAAVGMNWSGGAHFTRKGLFWLLVTLVAYSLTDMVETRLVLLPKSGNIIRDSFAIGTVCYAVLGILTLPLLARFRWSTRQFVKAAPFAVSWYLSQVALFVCFGLLGTVFGNVIQASRGLISIALGILLLHYGFGRLDARISRAMWLRRAAAAILMAAGIILYSLAKL